MGSDNWRKEMANIVYDNDINVVDAVFNNNNNNNNDNDNDSDTTTKKKKRRLHLIYLSPDASDSLDIDISDSDSDNSDSDSDSDSEIVYVLSGIVDLNPTPNMSLNRAIHYQKMYNNSDTDSDIETIVTAVKLPIRHFYPACHDTGR